MKLVTDEYIKSKGLKNIETTYCYVSRKVCLTNDADEVNILCEYLKSFVDGEKLVIVDEGWYCHSQQAISKKYGLQTVGYYLGVRGKDNGYDGCVRKGILFDLFGNNGRPTQYYGIFCTNCSMYEQMLTSREGSVKGYENTDNGIRPILRENAIEVKLYDEIIGLWQYRMLLIVKGLCAWKGHERVSKRFLGRMILKTVLFADRQRCEFLNRLDNDMIDNCHSTTQSPKGIKDVKINLSELLLHPDKYLGMVCKVQRKIYGNRLMNDIYKLLASFYYIYVRIMTLL